MAKFVFRLQPLLNLKLQMEDSLKNELGKAIQRLEYEKSLLVQIEDEKENNINQFNSESGKGVAVHKLREYGAYISLLKEKMEIQKESINVAQLSVDKYREELIKVVQERQMLEKLKEKKHEEYLKEQLKEEQKLNDEIVSFNQTTKTEQ